MLSSTEEDEAEEESCSTFCLTDHVHNVIRSLSLSPFPPLLPLTLFHPSPLAVRLSWPSGREDGDGSGQGWGEAGGEAAAC